MQHRVRELQNRAAQVLGLHELVDLAASYHRQCRRLDGYAAAVDELLAAALGHEDQLVIVVPVRLPRGGAGDRYALEELDVDDRAGVEAVDREAPAVGGRGQRHG